MLLFFHALKWNRNANVCTLTNKHPYVHPIQMYGILNELYCYNEMHKQQLKKKENKTNCKNSIEDDASNTT